METNSAFLEGGEELEFSLPITSEPCLVFAKEIGETGVGGADGDKTSSQLKVARACY